MTRDVFLPFQKSITDDYGTFSSHFRKLSPITRGHFPPISKKCHWLVWDIFLPFLKSVTHDLRRFPPISEKYHPWLGDIFLPFLKSVTYDYGTFSSRKVKCETFQIWEENVPWSYATLFRNGRKMSHVHMWHFSEMGGNCPIVVCDTF